MASSPTCHQHLDSAYCHGNKLENEARPFMTCFSKYAGFRHASRVLTSNAQATSMAKQNVGRITRLL
eukprot:1563022-Pleurochrysis_carterae.AAC.1